MGVNQLVIITNIIYILLINIMLADFHHLFPLFHTFKFVIYYFQFVNFTHRVQPSYQETLQNWDIQCNIHWPAD